MRSANEFQLVQQFGLIGTGKLGCSRRGGRTQIRSKISQGKIRFMANAGDHRDGDRRPLRARQLRH